MLELKGINKFFGEKVIYKNADLVLPNSGFFLLEGENGVGKTTLLNIIDCNDTDFDGKLIFNGLEITKKNATKYRKFNVFTLYQDAVLFEDLSIRQNLIKIAPNKISDDNIKNILKKVNLHNDLDQIVSSLSMGEKKRLMISFAFLFNPDILLCDEITNNLDEENTKDVLDAIKAVSKSCLVVFVSHYIPEKFKDVFDNKIFVDNFKLSLEKPIEISSTKKIAKAKTQRKNIFYSVFYQNRLFLIFFSIISVVLSGLGLCYAGATLPYTDPDTYFEEKKVEYVRNNFPYVFFDLQQNSSDIDSLERDAEIISCYLDVKQPNNKNITSDNIFYFKFLSGIELVNGKYPENYDEVLVPSTIFTNSIIDSVFNSNGKDYKVVGIYKSLDIFDKDAYRFSISNNLNKIESKLFVNGFISLYKENIEISGNAYYTLTYGINSGRNDVIGNYNLNKYNHSIFLNDGTNADEFLAKTYQDNITNKLLAVLFICLYFLFNLTSLIILFTLNKKKFVIYRLFGLDRSSLAKVIAEVLLISVIAPLTIFIIASLIVNPIFDANIVNQILSPMNLALAPYNYLFAICSIAYILAACIFAFAYNRIALKSDLKESLALIKKTTNR